MNTQNSKQQAPSKTLLTFVGFHFVLKLFEYIAGHATTHIKRMYRYIHVRRICLMIYIHRIYEDSFVCVSNSMCDYEVNMHFRASLSNYKRHGAHNYWNLKRAKRFVSKCVCGDMSIIDVRAMQLLCSICRMCSDATYGVGVCVFVNVVCVWVCLRYYWCQYMCARFRLPRMQSAVCAR